jgi:hypothetical protein
MKKEEIKKLVLKNFELIEKQDGFIYCDDAQLIDGEWYLPLWGCDTIQNILDDIED